MAFCSNCDQKFADGAKFCGNCGSAATTTDTEYAAPVAAEKAVVTSIPAGMSVEEKLNSVLKKVEQDFGSDLRERVHYGVIPEKKIKNVKKAFLPSAQEQSLILIDDSVLGNGGAGLFISTGGLRYTNEFRGVRRWKLAWENFVKNHLCISDEVSAGDDDACLGITDGLGLSNYISLWSEKTKPALWMLQDFLPLAVKVFAEDMQKGSQTQNDTSADDQEVSGLDIANMSVEDRIKEFEKLMQKATNFIGGGSPIQGFGRGDIGLGERVFLTPIPEKKLPYIQKAFFLLPQERVLFLVDDSLLGTGSAGLVLTTWGIRFNSSKSLRETQPLIWDLSWNDYVETPFYLEYFYSEEECSIIIMTKKGVGTHRFFFRWPTTRQSLIAAVLRDVLPDTVKLFYSGTIREAGMGTKINEFKQIVRNGIFFTLSNCVSFETFVRMKGVEERVFLVDIPTERLPRLQNLFKLTQDEQSLMFIDDPLPNDGTAGLILTTWGVHFMQFVKDKRAYDWATSWKDFFETPYSVEYTEEKGQKFLALWNAPNRATATKGDLIFFVNSYSQTLYGFLMQILPDTAKFFTESTKNE